MAGYSPNPLLKKLGIKAGYSIQVFNEPDNYWDDLGPLPDDVEGVDEATEASLDFVHFFTKSADELRAQILPLKASIKKTGMIWISWPKATSPLQADFNGNDVRSAGLTNGLVDTKVCAVDHDWSGMKFQYRKKER